MLETFGLYVRNLPWHLIENKNQELVKSLFRTSLLFDKLYFGLFRYYFKPCEAQQQLLVARMLEADDGLGVLVRPFYFQHLAPPEAFVLYELACP